MVKKLLNYFKPTLVIEEAGSKFNKKIKVVKSWGLGTYLDVGGLTQSGWIIAKIWEQTLRKVRCNRQEVKEILILGLGGGSVIKPIRKYFSNAKITGVEIDPVMVKFGTRYLGLGASKGLEIVVEDALDFLSRRKQVKGKRYDLLLIDLYIGNKIPDKFESDRFLKLILKPLSDNGIVVFNRLYFKEKKKEALVFVDKIKKYFSRVETYYPTTNLMLICQK